MTAALKKQPDGTIELTITIPSLEVKKVWQEVVDDTTKNAKLSGFRKGKAPKKLVEENLDTAKVQEETLRKLLPQTYVEAVKQHNLNPIISPRIHVNPESLAGGPEKDWQFTAFTCEKPEIDLKNYKEEVKKITAKSKIVIPGKEPVEPSLDDIVKALTESATVTVPRILVDGEVERLLSQTIDDVKKLGLTLDQYLASTGKTPEALRDEYAKKATNDIKLEFVLQKVGETENITVEPKEVEEAIQKAKTDEERKNLETNRYLLASILRQQKTLDFLKNL